MGISFRVRARVTVTVVLAIALSFFGRHAGAVLLKKREHDADENHDTDNHRAWDIVGEDRKW